MLPKTMTEQDLHDMFSIYGELREVHVIRGPEGGPKGCAFVKFVERDAALAAIDNLNETIPQVNMVDRSTICVALFTNCCWSISSFQGSTRPLVVKFADGKKTNKDDPWQQMYRPGGGPMHMQQRMMGYPYGQQPHGPPGYPGHGQHTGIPRYGGYPSQGGGPGGYYGGPDGPDSKRGGGYGADGLLVKPPGEDGFEDGLPPPPMQGGGAHHYGVDSESSHVRPPEGEIHCDVDPCDTSLIYILCCLLRSYRPSWCEPVHLPPAQGPDRRGLGHAVCSIRQRDLRQSVRGQEDLRF